jgi:4-aminobutyrate aminotransferase-like enzyme
MSVGTVVDIVREPLLKRIAELEEFLRLEIRKMEMQANIMRDKRRTGGWEGAEKVAMAFERSAIRHQDILDGKSGE